MSTGRTAIVTASDRGYLPAACCQLKSSWDHLTDRSGTDLFLVVCDVSPKDIDDARSFFRDRDVPAKVLMPEDVIAKIQPITQRWPRAAYLRLYFDEMFGPEYDRLVYFDADTRVRAPLEPLIESDLHGAPVGAVHDFIYYVTGNIRRRRRDLFLGHDAPYLQSGVMVFDWPKTLATGGLARSRQFLQEHADRCYEAPDQDALNGAFAGQWTPLDPRWNLHELYLMFGGTLEPYLEHYTSTKPWSRRRPAAWRDAAEWYRKQLAGSAWPDFIPEQSTIDIVRSRLAFMKFRYAPKLRDEISRRAPLVLDALGKPRARSDDEELPWAPKCRRDVEDMAHALIDEAAGRRGRLLPPESVLAGPTW